MDSLSADVLEVAHRLPGRLRVRFPALRRRREEMERVAREAVALPGVLEVEGHPFTGSALIRFDPARIAEGRIVAVLREAAGVSGVLQPGEPKPPPAPRTALHGSSVGRATMKAFRALDDGIYRLTDGGMDLGTIVTLGFLGAGALEVVASGKIPAPPWFNLAWWGFRTFMTVEVPVVRDEESSPLSGTSEA